MDDKEAVVMRATAEIAASLRGELPFIDGRERHRQRLEKRRQHLLSQQVLETSFWPRTPAPPEALAKTEFDPYGKLRYRNGGKYRGD